MDRRKAEKFSELKMKTKTIFKKAKKMRKTPPKKKMKKNMYVGNPEIKNGSATRSFTI